MAGAIATPTVAQDSLCYLVDSQGNTVSLEQLCGGSEPAAPALPASPAEALRPEAPSPAPVTGIVDPESTNLLAEGFADEYCSARRSGRSHNDAIQEASIAAYNAAPTTAPGNPAAALEQFSGSAAAQAACPDLYPL
jgi:hypothetical protein